MSTIDTTSVGQMAAGLMETIETEFGENARVGTVALVVEIEHIDDEGDAATSITCACSDRRGWVQHGLLTSAAAMLAPRST